MNELERYYQRFDELSKFLGTRPPFDKGLREVVDFLLLPASYRSQSYIHEVYAPLPADDPTPFVLTLLRPIPYMIFCDQLRMLTAGQFVGVVADLLRALGGQVIPGAKGADGAVDLFWMTPEGTYIVQCKKWKNKVGEPIVREVFGAAVKYKSPAAFVVTASQFTENAKGFAEDLSPRIGLIDGMELFGLMKLRMPTVAEDIKEGRWMSNNR